MSRPRDCMISTEDLECVGCGVKLRLLKPGECYHETCEKEEAVKRESAERLELARLKAKYEVKP